MFALMMLFNFIENRRDQREHPVRKANSKDYCSVVQFFFSLHHFSHFHCSLALRAKVLQLVGSSRNPVHAAFDALFGQMPPLQSPSTFSSVA